MIGRPLTKTFIETALHYIGLLGAGLGLVLVIVSPLILLVYPLFTLLAPYTFFIGVAGVTVGLFVAGFGQALGSLRLIAHNLEIAK